MYVNFSKDISLPNYHTLFYGPYFIAKHIRYLSVYGTEVQPSCCAAFEQRGSTTRRNTGAANAAALSRFLLPRTKMSTSKCGEHTAR